MKLQFSHILLTAALLALLGISHSLPDGPLVIGFCKKPRVTPSFEPKRFFNNKWYIWKSVGSFFGFDGTCTGVDTKMSGNEVELLNFQFEPIIQQFYTVKAHADAAYITMQGLPFPVNYELFGHINYTTAFSVLGTDYDNWAAVYLCKQLVGMKIELSWIMLRESKKTPTPEEEAQISYAISGIDFDLEKYRTRDRRSCGVGEPHL